MKSAPLCQDGYNYFQYTASRGVPTEEQAKTKDQKAAREKLIKEGKPAPEVFDKSFTDTPKSFYTLAEKQLDGCLETLDSLDQVCGQKFGVAAAPSFGRLKDSLGEVRHLVHTLLQKKRETEPDPVQETAPPAEPEPPAGIAAGAIVEPVARVAVAAAAVSVPVAEPVAFTIPTSIMAEPGTATRPLPRWSLPRPCCASGSRPARRLPDAARLAMGRVARRRRPT